MSKLGKGMIEEIIDRIPNGNFMYEYNNRYDTYTVYFKNKDGYARFKNLTETEVITILSALYEMCEKAGKYDT